MGKIKTYKSGISAFISSEKGQRFFNFAYSIGAAIVIWGALFKILHLPGGNFLLSLGMGTEVLMFMLTAFDRPPREYKWENVFPVFDTENPDDRPDFASGTGVVMGGGVQAPANIQAPVLSQNASPGEIMDTVSDATRLYLAQITDMTNELRRLQATTASLNEVSDVLLQSYKAITDNSQQITASSTGYVEQMQALNRNISGLNTIYEIQLKGVSSQLDAIDRVNRGIKDIREVPVVSDYKGLVLGAMFNGVTLQPGARIPLSAVVTLQVGSGFDDTLDTGADVDTLAIDNAIDELNIE